MHEKGICKGVFVGLLLSGGVYASESITALERHPSIEVVNEERGQQQEHPESVSFPVAIDLLGQRQERSFSLGQRWETVQNLTEPRDEIQGSVVQRRNADDLIEQRVTQQVSPLAQQQTRRLLWQFLLCCFCLSQREDEDNSATLAVQEAPSVISNSLSLPTSHASSISTVGVLGSSDKDSLELVEMSSSSKSSVKNTHPPAPYPSISASSLESFFDGEHL